MLFSLSIYCVITLLNMISKTISFQSQTVNILKYDNIQPSLVYQMICNGTESKILRKAQTMLSYADVNIKLLKESTENRINNILNDCDSRYWVFHCNETDNWNDTIEDIILRKGLINRNMSQIKENMEEICNNSNETENSFKMKINRTIEKITQRESDLRLLDEVILLIEDGLIKNETKQNLLEIMEKTKNFVKMKTKKRLRSSEIGEEILEILMEIKQKIVKEISDFKIKKTAFEKTLENRIDEFTAEKANNQRKLEELENLLQEMEHQQKELENQIKSCEKIVQNQKIRCEGIRSNGTVYLEAFGKELSLFDDISELLD